MTTVVNIRRDPYDVYIGRAGKGQDGYFGNPIARGERCCICGCAHEKPTETLPCYRIYFGRRIADDGVFRQRVLALKGLRLGCFCKPAACHGDVIAEYIASAVAV